MRRPSRLVAGSLAPLLLAGAVAAHAGKAAAPPGVGGLTALPGPEAPGPNVLANPGFEARAGGGAEGWQLAPDGVWSVDTAAHGGHAALRLSASPGQHYVPTAEQTVTLEPGLYTIEGWVRTQALGGGPPGSGVRLCLDGRPRVNWWQCTPVTSGTTSWTLLRQGSIAVRDRGAYRVTAGAYGAPEGVAWFDDLALTATRKPPLDVYLLYPNFRGLLFDDRSQIVRAAITVAAGARGAAGVRVSLVNEASGTAVAHRDYPATGSFTAEVDAAAAPAGALRLRAELVDGAGTALYRYPDYRLVKVPARTREGLRVWYDEANVVHLRGKPAFVLGLYTTSGYSMDASAYARGQDGWGDDRIAQAPVNMLINYHLGRAPIPALNAYMDDLEAHGIHYLQTVNFYYQADPQYRDIEYPAAREGEDALNHWVARALGRHSGLAGFYTADERPAEMVPAVFRQYRQLAAGAPGSVTYVVLGDGWENQAPLWRDSADVLGLDPYPITRPAGLNQLAMVGEWTRLGRDAVKRSRPVWMVIQYFPLTTLGGWPTRQQLRAMSWMAIVEGARGLFYWSYGAKGLAWVKDPREREARWADLVTVTREIKALEPVLLAPDAPLVTAESSRGVVRVLGKRGPDGARYLFAYNTGRAATTVTWTLAERAAEVADLDGQAGVSSNGATITAPFGAYQVRRLRLR